jgi:protein-S-isoprenylcysteine O-methyltransferase Ste14
MGYFFTFLQFFLIGLIFFTPPFLPQSVSGLVVLFLSFTIGAWSILVFRHTKINVFPYLRNGASLVRKGPYRYVRHPMYTSVILFSFAYFVDNPDWIYGSYFLSMIVVLVLKMNFEEKQLALHFDNYESEFFKTYRIIPCVY